MKRDSRLSGVLHCLLHMAERGTPVTSEWLARAMHTNPVVIRRLMGGLRDAGFVASAKGHGGGWVLSCRLEDITLRDVHEAVGAPELSVPRRIIRVNEVPALASGKTDYVAIQRIAETDALAEQDGGGRRRR